MAKTTTPRPRRPKTATSQEPIRFAPEAEGKVEPCPWCRGWGFTIAEPHRKTAANGVPVYEESGS